MALRVQVSNDTFATSGRSTNRIYLSPTTAKNDRTRCMHNQIVDAETGMDELDDVEDFLIYPNQLLLQPDEQQVVTLTWVGLKILQTNKRFV